jgi:hypothetical protein
MSRSSVLMGLGFASMLAATGCSAKGGDGSGSASASGEKVARTCKDAGGRYGEHFNTVRC